MNTKQIALVQSTFALVEPIAATAAKLFYGKLFELDPSVRPMFKEDITEQGEKLMRMLGAAVKGLSDLPSLVPIVQSLGENHLSYGVVDEHYDTVGDALIWTLQQGLGDAFTSEVEDAWLITYTTLATVMKDAARAKAA